MSYWNIHPHYLELNTGFPRTFQGGRVDDSREEFLKQQIKAKNLVLTSGWDSSAGLGVCPSHCCPDRRPWCAGVCSNNCTAHRRASPLCRDSCPWRLPPLSPRRRHPRRTIPTEPRVTSTATSPRRGTLRHADFLQKTSELPVRPWFFVRTKHVSLSSKLPTTTDADDIKPARLATRARRTRRSNPPRGHALAGRRGEMSGGLFNVCESTSAPCKRASQYVELKH